MTNHLRPAMHLLDMEATTTAADQDLFRIIASAVGGDDVAFARIVAANHEDMRRVCSYVTRDDTVAEEAVQAAWLIVWRKLGTIRDPKRLRPWLVSVAVNESKAAPAEASPTLAG